jgi:hypothetical protein
MEAMRKDSVRPSMRVKRQAQMRARAERRLKALAWRLGLTPRLLKAALKRRRSGGGLANAA